MSSSDVLASATGSRVLNPSYCATTHLRETDLALLLGADASVSDSDGARVAVG